MAKKNTGLKNLWTKEDHLSDIVPILQKDPNYKNKTTKMMESYTYDMYEDDVTAIFDHIIDSYEGEVVLFGVMRGSLPIVTHLSNLMTADMGIIKFQSYAGKDDKVAEFLHKPNCDGKTIVVIDDIYDTGRTISKINDLFVDFPEKIAYYTIYAKEGQTIPSNVTSLRKNSKFVDFWWEK